MNPITRSRSMIATALVFAAALGAWARPARSAAAAPPNIMMSAVAQGTVVLNTDQGTISFCSFTFDDSPGGNTPTPIGKCTRIGALAVSASGYSMVAAGATMFVYNKATGYIVQCATKVGSRGEPFGRCAQMANTSTM